MPLPYIERMHCKTDGAIDVAFSIHFVLLAFILWRRSVASFGVG
jgi:hypothetical protein